MINVYKIIYQKFLNKLKRITPNNFILNNSTTLQKYLFKKYNISKFTLFCFLFLYIKLYIFPRIKNIPYNDWVDFSKETGIFEIIKIIFPTNCEKIYYLLRNYLTVIYYRKYQEKQFSNIKWFYLYIFNIISNFKIHYLMNTIGCGGNGFIIERNYYIIKIHFLQPTSFITKFIEYSKTKRKFFPIIYKSTKYCICEEKVKINTKKCKEYDKFLSIDKTNIFNNVKLNLNLYKDKRFSKKHKQMLKWCADIILTNIREEYDNYFDIILDNIGERDNGDIVLFDP